MSFQPPDLRLGGLAHQVASIWRSHSITATRGEFLWREIAERREMWHRHWLMAGYLEDRPADFTGFELLVCANHAPVLSVPVAHLACTD